MAATEKNQYFLSENSPLISIPQRLSPPLPVAFGMVANQARSAWRDPLDGASDRAQPGLAQTPSHPGAVLLLALQPPQPGLLDVIKCNLAAVKLGYKCLGRDYLQLPEHFF